MLFHRLDSGDHGPQIQFSVVGQIAAYPSGIAENRQADQLMFGRLSGLVLLPGG